MKKVMVLLALGAIGAGFAAWAAPSPKKAAEPMRRSAPAGPRG